jgi:hypothetical protein
MHRALIKDNEIERLATELARRLATSKTSPIIGSDDADSRPLPANFCLSLVLV